jgi:ferritin heavy chain
MLLKAAPAFSLLHPPCGETLGPLFFSVSSPSSRSVSPLNYSSASLPSSLRFSSAKKVSGSVICLASNPPTGVVFQPFEEAKKELDLIPNAPHLSLARKNYSDECEAAVNEQIKWVFCLDFIASNLLHVS